MGYAAIGTTVLFPGGIPGIPGSEPAPSTTKRLSSVAREPSQWPTPQPEGTITRYTGTYADAPAPASQKRLTSVAAPKTGRLGLQTQGAGPADVERLNRLGLPTAQAPSVDTPVEVPVVPQTPAQYQDSPVQQTATAERRRRQLRNAGIAAAVVVVGGVGFYLWKKRSR